MYHPPSPYPQPPHASPPSPAFVLITTSPEQMVLCFALARSDRQPLSANRLPENQLTGLHSARCFYHCSSPIHRSQQRRNIGATHRLSVGLQQVGDLRAACLPPRRPVTDLDTPGIHALQTAEPQWDTGICVLVLFEKPQ
ncbi:hypothetical protein CgunFtcFv8_014923 [Champsocephalus gunnari]|uniref:Uncharacterized protein n=1 Tax=Champsocephalus gunnari TaxID=52237 RepID=A0AAN8E7H5_CHAGU|nr:hypothetical protein CgunFtcFv8_014923 [Champsocephalus gunnari]